MTRWQLLVDAALFIIGRIKTAAGLDVAVLFSAVADRGAEIHKRLFIHEVAINITLSRYVYNNDK